MGGMFGVVSRKDCVTDLFFGIDYHSLCSDDPRTSSYTSYYRHDSGGCIDWRTRLSCARP